MIYSANEQRYQKEKQLEPNTDTKSDMKIAYISENLDIIWLVLDRQRLLWSDQYFNRQGKPNFRIMDSGRVTACLLDKTWLKGNKTTSIIFHTKFINF